jgi:hypothetical protein
VRSRPGSLAATGSMELLKSISPPGRREASAWRSTLSTVICEADLARELQRRRSRRALHDGTTDAAGRAPCAASRIGMAVPEVWASRWTRVPALVTAAAAARCKAAFMARQVAGGDPRTPLATLWLKLGCGDFLFR